MVIYWRSFEQAADVQYALMQHFSEKTTVADVSSFAAEQGLECSDLVDNVMYCSAPANTQSLIIKAKWLIQFLFREQELIGIEVEQGLIGP